MTGGWNVQWQDAEPMQTVLRPRKHAVKRYRLMSWLLARKAVSEVVATQVHFKASPQAVWNHLVFYEEVPEPPPFLLRTLLPHPIRTEGDKTRVGATVCCAYRGSNLVKRITAVEPPHLLKFEVVEQRLGIEDCVLTHSGSYQIHACGDAADVVLMTQYAAYLRPRYLWRPLEALLVKQLHSHILRGVYAALLPRTPTWHPSGAEPPKAQCARPENRSYTVSQLCSRR